MSDNVLGPRVRLWGINGTLALSQRPKAEIVSLVTEIITEGTRFIDSAAPKDPAATPTLFKHKMRKAPAHSTAPVDVSVRTVPKAALERVLASAVAAAADQQQQQQQQSPPPPPVDRRGVRAEVWVCRRSVHEDAAVPGSASWAEFVRHIKANHAVTEKAFTPTMDAHIHVQDLPAVSALAPLVIDGVAYADVTCTVEAVRHRIGRPLLADRTFFVLQTTCSAVDSDEFLVVNVPLPDRPDPMDPVDMAKGAVLGAYVSVERLRVLPPGSSDAGRIEWLMATASDAKGMLPRFVQDLAVPSEIVKDVPQFLAWADTRRKVPRPSADDDDVEQPQVTSSVSEAA